jgi:hypothetical protein
MLREFTHPRQNPGDPFRRVFSSEDMDLFVWYAPDGAIVGFQLCYDTARDARALTYRNGSYSHAAIDQGESDPRKNQSPILTVDGRFAKQAVLARFAATSAELEPELVRFLTEKLVQCPDSV